MGIIRHGSTPVLQSPVSSRTWSPRIHISLSCHRMISSYMFPKDPSSLSCECTEEKCEDIKLKWYNYKQMKMVKCKSNVNTNFYNKIWAQMASERCSERCSNCLRGRLKLFTRDSWLRVKPCDRRIGFIHPKCVHSNSISIHLIFKEPKIITLCY